MAPQCEWPHTTMFLIASTVTPYSIPEFSAPERWLNGGTMLPAFRITNNSPGSLWVTKAGLMRESAQPIHSV
jgi:hypothetical protein